MPSRDRRVLVVLALLSSLCLLAEAAGMLAPTLLYAAPLLVIALPLLAGRYVGEEQLTRLARPGRRSHRGPVARQAPPAGARWTSGVVARGGRLIADSLAVRPPPPAALAQ
ncbi:MAG TPA: hypothetical protein VHF90_04005 [Thermoleophilaceae bacterium]|nr:hypothetical protein [Thermoleophilaceae bacterium]